jgi:hypothetical protein
LKPADEIGRAAEAEELECRGGQARLVALVAHDDDEVIELRCIGMPMLARRIHSPFEHVAWDHERAGDDSVSRDLRLTPDVDQPRSVTPRAICRSCVEAGQSTSSASKKVIYGQPGHDSG